LALALLVGIAAARPAPAQATSLYPESRLRFGYGVTWGWNTSIASYPISAAALKAGWYTDFTWQVTPLRPNGIEFVQVLSVREPFTNWTGLTAAVTNNPGALWIVGNEPDRQEPLHPRAYAQRYREFYTFIKGLDPTARLANGPIVQGTPLRMRYLDDVFHEYQSLYGETMPVDVWTTHEQILREEYDPSNPNVYGCFVPQAYIPRLYNGVIYSVPKPIYCTNTSTGAIGYCQYNEAAELLPGQTWTQGMMYAIADNASSTLFIEHIQRFRQWMKDHGQQNKPLMVTEYGVLYPSILLAGGDDAVLAFMDATFRYLLGTTSFSLGLPADGYRMVQAWNWFSLNVPPYPEPGGYNGSLAEWDEDVLTKFGVKYAQFTNDADPQTGTASPSGGVFQAGPTQYITTTFSDADGIGDLDDVYLMINADELQQGGVYLRFDPDNDRVFLRNLTDTAWVVPDGHTVGTWNVADTTNVTLDARESSVTRAGNTLTVRWGLRFKTPMSGVRYTQWLKARDKHAMFDGWDPAAAFGIGAWAPETVGVSPTSGDLGLGATYLFQTTYSDFNGASNIASAYFLLNASASESGGVYLRYDPATNLLYLRDVANTAWLPAGGIAAGSAGTVSNELVTVKASQCQAIQSGATLTMTWALEFLGPVRGRTLNEYLLVRDAGGLQDGWDLYGAVRVRDVQMQTVQVAPSSGWSEPGALVSFAASYYHSEGWQSMDDVYLLINGTTAQTNCVYARYDPQLNQLWIRLPADTAWTGGGQPGSGGVAKTAWFALDYAATTVTKSADGKTLTVSWAVRPSYRLSALAHNLYLRLTDIGGAAEGWNDRGDWVINRAPSALILPTIYAQPLAFKAGTTFSLEPRYRDQDQSSDLRYLYLAIANNPPTADFHPQGVYIRYDTVERKLYLADWAGTTWGTGYSIPNDTVTLSNEAVNITLKVTKASDADTWTKMLTLRLSFKSAFVGPRKVYMRAVDKWAPAYGGDTGWTYKAALTVLAP